MMDNDLNMDQINAALQPVVQEERLVIDDAPFEVAPVNALDALVQHLRYAAEALRVEAYQRDVTDWARQYTGRLFTRLRDVVFSSDIVGVAVAEEFSPRRDTVLAPQVSNSPLNLRAVNRLDTEGFTVGYDRITGALTVELLPRQYLVMM